MGDLFVGDKCCAGYLDNISDGVYCLNTDGYFMYVNNTILKRSGIPRDQFYRLHFLDVVSPEFHDQVKRNFRQVMEGKEGIPYELKYKTPNGQIITVEVHSRPIYEGEKIVGLQGISRDITDRKRTEEALQDSESRYRAIVEDQEEMICRFLPDSTLTFVNDAYCRYFGKSKRELIGKKFQPFIVDDDMKMVMEKIAALSKEKPSETHEQRSFTASGGVCWQQWINRALFDEQGSLKEIQAVGRDITTLKQIEERLRESERRFRHLIENIPIGVFTYEGSKFRYINPACEKITGYTSEELHEKDFWETIHPDFQETAREYVRKRQMGEPVPERFQLKFITKSGEVRWGERSAIIIEQKENPLVLVMVTDVTERKHAEEELMRSEEKYRAVLENASDAMLLADEHGNLIEANRKAEEFFGYSREELFQMRYTQLHPIAALDQTAAAYKDIVTHGKGGLLNGVMLRKDGTAFPVDITGTAIEYGGKRVLQASFRDITEHKQIEDMLEKRVQERTAELSEKNKLLAEEITERKRTATVLQKKEKELVLHARKLEEMNSALKVLLKQREEDKNELEEKVMANVKELLLPYLEELKKSRLDSKSKVHVSILEANLNSIISPFTHRLSSKYSGFTPREIQVSNLIRQGKSTKDIAGLMGISRSAINIYRNQIRHKLGIVSKKINLRTHLMSLSY
jgi:PAS domain S-box-containing protein